MSVTWVALPVQACEPVWGGSLWLTNFGFSGLTILSYLSSTRCWRPLIPQNISRSQVDCSRVFHLEVSASQTWRTSRSAWFHFAASNHWICQVHTCLESALGGYSRILARCPGACAIKFLLSDQSFPCKAGFHIGLSWSFLNHRMNCSDAAKMSLALSIGLYLVHYWISKSYLSLSNYFSSLFD